VVATSVSDAGDVAALQLQARVALVCGERHSIVIAGHLRLLSCLQKSVIVFQISSSSLLHHHNHTLNHNFHQTNSNSHTSTQLNQQPLHNGFWTQGRFRQ
jgi:hypothetical protein